MYAVFHRDNGTLLAIHDFDYKICSDNRTFYFVGSIDGLINSNYHVERDLELCNIVANLPVCLPSVYGRFAGLSIRDGVLELAAADISAVEELYYAATEKELIVSTDFFDLAKIVGSLDYDAFELHYFIKHGFCHKGKTTFKDVYRLPPGEALKRNVHGMPVTESYLNQFKGVAVTFDVFKNAINHSVSSIIQKEPSLDDVIMFSGGVDSAVLLSLIKNVNDVTAITYRFIPALSWNEHDVLKAEKMARKMQVAQEFVDVNLNEIPMSYLYDVIESMPFAAHLSINFKKVYEAVHNRKKRLWSGQNLDTLYCYAVTNPFFAVNRFLLSDKYVRMLKGVKGYRQYQPVKKPLDLFLKLLFGSIRKQRFQTPNSVDELVEYFNDSDTYLALRVIREQDEDQPVNTEASECISVSEIRRTLFDEELGCFFTGRDHKVQLQSIKLYHVETSLLFSTPNIIHLLRKLELSALDVVRAKRLMYRYARELGVPKISVDNWGDLSALLSARKGGTREWAQTFESTSFGVELRESTENFATEMGLRDATKTTMLRKMDATAAGRLQEQLGILWANNVRQKLSRMGVELKQPLFTKM